MKPNGLGNITSSAVAPALRTLRLGTLLSRPDFRGEVLPQYYGTYKTDSAHGTAKGLLVEAHADSGATASTAWAGCLRYLRETGQQLGYAAGLTRLRRAATAGVGSNRTPSICRSGDRARQSVGEEEAGVVRSDKKEEWIQRPNSPCQSSVVFGGQGYK